MLLFVVLYKQSPTHDIHLSLSNAVFTECGMREYMRAIGHRIHIYKMRAYLLFVYIECIHIINTHSTLSISILALTVLSHLVNTYTCV